MAGRVGLGRAGRVAGSWSSLVRQAAPAPQLPVFTPFPFLHTNIGRGETAATRGNEGRTSNLRILAKYFGGKI